jgi:hypothetical protein
MELFSEETDFLVRGRFDIVRLGVVTEGGQERLKEVVVREGGATVDVWQGVLLG